MKKPKYRAWDKKNKWMTDVLCLNIGEKSTDCILVHPDSLKLPHREFYNQGYDSIHLMQCTGIQDKNGNDIYDGDVIIGVEGDYSDPKVFTSKIRWSDEGYRACWWIAGRNISLSKGVVKDLQVEVVGNVYQNQKEDGSN